MTVDIPIRVSLPLLTAKRGRLTNVSLSGGFIALAREVRVLSRVQIVLPGPQHRPQEAVSIAAYVARKVTDGIGVEWCEFAPAAVVELIRESTAAAPAPGLAASAMRRVAHGADEPVNLG